RDHLRNELAVGGVRGVGGGSEPAAAPATSPAALRLGGLRLRRRYRDGRGYRGVLHVPGGVGPAASLPPERGLQRGRGPGDGRASRVFLPWAGGRAVLRVGR